MGGGAEVGPNLEKVQSPQGSSVRYSCGLAVGSRLKNPCVNKKWRLVGFYDPWLFSFLDNDENTHLKMHPKFQQIYRNMSSLLSELVHSY